jgi:hypothetical protein
MTGCSGGMKRSDLVAASHPSLAVLVANEHARSINACSRSLRRCVEQLDRSARREARTRQRIDHVRIDHGRRLVRVGR